MKRIRQYHLPLAATLIGLVLLVLPQFAFAASAVESFFQEILWTVLVTITGLILRMGAIIFDYGVNTFVIQFAGMYLNSGVGTAVDKVWFIVRDFVNMLFIFGLVYIGFKMILDTDNSNTKRWLVNLIMAAIFINFSLFATKLVIDFSNQIATQVAISGLVEEGKLEYKDNGWGMAPKIEIADYVLNLMGIKGLLAWDLQKNIGNSDGGWGYIFGTAIFFTITGFVLAAGGILLMVRFVVLVIFMIISPFMFISWILPPIQDTMNKYWKMFLSRAFFAPIYFIFIYFSLEVLNGLNASIGLSDSDSKWVKTFTERNGAEVVNATESSIPFFFVACGFMIASLVIANKLGAEGADKALSLGKSMRNRAASYTKKGAISTGRFAARNTVGAGAQALSRESGNARQRYLLRDAQNPTNSRIRQWARDKRQAVLASGEKASVAGSETHTQRQQRVEKRQQDYNRAINEDRRRSNLPNNGVGPTTANSTSPEIQARQDSQRTRRNNLQGMSNDELLAFVRDNPEALTQPGFAALFSDAQVTTIRDSGILDTGQISDFNARRDEGTFEDINATLTNSNATTEDLTATMEELNRIMSTMSNDRLQRMNIDTLSNENVASRLTDAQLETLRQSGRFSTAQITQVENARNSGLTRIASGGSLAGPASGVGPLSAGASNVAFQTEQRRNLVRNAQEGGRRPVAVLRDPNMAQYLTTQIVQEFMKNNPGDTAAFQAIRDNIQTNVIDNGGPGVSYDAWNSWTQTTPFGREFGTFNPPPGGTPPPATPSATPPTPPTPPSAGPTPAEERERTRRERQERADRARDQKPRPIN